MNQPRHFPGLLIVLGALAGCSGGTDFGEMGSISGKLTMDGQPLEAGTQLLFMKIDAGYAAFGDTDEAGNYTITWIREGERRSEVPVGDYQVLIQPPAGQDTESMSADQMLSGEDVPIAEPKFPRKYQQHATSGLEYTIEPGENRVDIDLKSDA